MKSLFPIALVVLGLAGCASGERLTESAGVKVGEPAPDFSLPDQNGAFQTLGQFRGDRVVVLYFYPADDTPGCTTQACAFRDSYEDFTAAGAEVIGISGDSGESHQEFIAGHGLPFVLLSDETGEVRDLYGAPSMLGIPGRITFVIDRNGIVRLIFRALFGPEQHIEEALRVVLELTTARP